MTNINENLDRWFKEKWVDISKKLMANTLHADEKQQVKSMAHTLNVGHLTEWVQIHLKHRERWAKVRKSLLFVRNAVQKRKAGRTRNHTWPRIKISKKPHLPQPKNSETMCLMWLPKHPKLVSISWASPSRWSKVSIGSQDCSWQTHHQCIGVVGGKCWDCASEGQCLQVNQVGDRTNKRSIWSTRITWSEITRKTFNYSFARIAKEVHRDHK